MGVSKRGSSVAMMLMYEAASDSLCTQSTSLSLTSCLDAPALHSYMQMYLSRFSDMGVCAAAAMALADVAASFESDKATCW